MALITMLAPIIRRLIYIEVVSVVYGIVSSDKIIYRSK